MWGTFFPLISEALTGTEATVGPPWFNRLTTPLALVLVLLTGIGPVLAWRRVTPGDRSSASWLVPLAFTGAGAGRAARADQRRRQRPVADHVLLRRRSCWRWSGRSSGAGPRARRVMTGESWPRALARLTGPQPAPLRRLPRARRDRGAVPRAWRPPRRSSSSATCGCRRARASTVGDYEVTYQRPDRAARRRQRRHRRADLAGRRDAGAQGRRDLHAAAVAQLLLDHRPVQGRDLALLRGRGHQRGGRALGPAPRLLAGGAARPRLAREADRPRRPQVRRLARRRSRRS